MSLFKNKPIRKKLMTGMLITSSVVLLMTCAIYFIYEYVSFKRTLVEQTTVLAKMCAANSSAALVFGNAADAESVLSALQADPNIVSAILYDISDSAFATYPKSLSIDNAANPKLVPGFHFNKSRLEGFIPVIHDGKKSEAST